MATIAFGLLELTAAAAGADVAAMLALGEATARADGDGAAGEGAAGDDTEDAAGLGAAAAVAGVVGAAAVVGAACGAVLQAASSALANGATAPSRSRSFRREGISECINQVPGMLPAARWSEASFRR
jgi:hypothetical protein